ncbi:37S ribosomal protein, mitochondrial [Tulasnella sp. 331]|nr:37S ribosomal protein, mitochondrial [Tulasnella sp. 331]KAG8877314.1 37S ribosomal protein, mitochondrial [Tulasnella sp. 332]
MALRKVSTVSGTTTVTPLPPDATVLESTSYPIQPPPAPPQPSSDLDELIENRRWEHSISERFSKLGSSQSRETSFQPHHPLHRPVPPNSLTLSALLASGAHLGHAASRLRPAFLPYAYGTRSGITIIDLDHTLPMLRRAANVVRAVAQNNGSVLFVGTHETLRSAVIKAAQRMGRNGYQLSTRWKAGTLTNAREIFGEDLTREQNYVPDLVVLLNPLDNMVLIKECAHKHIPTIGIIDSNVDPRIVMYPIPANDDSVRTAELIVGMLSLAGKQGVQAMGAAEATRAANHQEQEPPRDRPRGRREDFE